MDKMLRYGRPESEDRRCWTISVLRGRKGHSKLPKFSEVGVLDRMPKLPRYYARLRKPGMSDRLTRASADCCEVWQDE